MARPTSFGKDTGLQVRMTVTLFLLGAVYAVLIGALFASGASGVTIAVIAGGLFLFQLFASDKLALRAMGAREVSPQEAPELHAMIERLCVQADLPKPTRRDRRHLDAQRVRDRAARRRPRRSARPRGSWTCSRPPSSRASWPTSSPTSQNRDVMVMTIAELLRHDRRRTSCSSASSSAAACGGGDDDDGPSFIVADPRLARRLRRSRSSCMQALSRYREFAADRGAAMITGRPSALASALMKISGDDGADPAAGPARASSELNAFFIFPAGVEEVDRRRCSRRTRRSRSGSRALQRLEAQLQGAAPASPTA